MSDFLLTPLLLVAAAGIAVGTIPFLMALVRLIFSKAGYLPYFFFMSTFLGGLQIAISGRNLFATIGDIEEATTPVILMPTYWIMMNRTSSALIVFAACQRIIRCLLNSNGRPYRTILIITAFLFFFLTNVLSPALFSSHPSFTHEYLYFTLGGIAALLFSEGEEEIAIRSVRDALFALLIFSACVGLWNPSLVFFNNYSAGIIPGLTYRYAGLSNHPNAIGIYIVLFLPCLLKTPFTKRWLNIFAWALGLASLILCQSKTSWIAFIFSMSCSGYYKYADFSKQRLFNFKNPILPAILILTVMISTSAFLGTVMFSEMGSKTNAFFSSRAGSELLTMTGRNVIWDVAINEWRQSPLFGYGLTIWDEAHRAKIGMDFAVSAHNHFYQTLSSAGIVGVIGLFIYVPTLFWHALKTAKSSEGLSLSIFIILFLRSFSEALEVQSYDFTHFLLLMVIGAQFKSRQQGKLVDPTLIRQDSTSPRGFN